MSRVPSGLYVLKMRWGGWLLWVAEIVEGRWRLNRDGIGRKISRPHPKRGLEMGALMGHSKSQYQGSAN